MANKAWSNVFSFTIINNFKKAGFIKDFESNQTIDIENCNENCNEDDWNRLIRLMKLNNMKFDSLRGDGLFFNPPPVFEIQIRNYFIMFLLLSLNGKIGENCT